MYTVAASSTRLSPREQLREDGTHSSQADPNSRLDPYCHCVRRDGAQRLDCAQPHFQHLGAPSSTCAAAQQLDDHVRPPDEPLTRARRVGGRAIRPPPAAQHAKPEVPAAPRPGTAGFARELGEAVPRDRLDEQRRETSRGNQRGSQESHPSTCRPWPCPARMTRCRGTSMP